MVASIGLELERLYALEPPLTLNSVFATEGSSGNRGAAVLKDGHDALHFVKIHQKDCRHPALREALVTFNLSSTFPVPSPRLNHFGGTLTRIGDHYAILFPFIHGTSLRHLIADPMYRHRSVVTLARIHESMGRKQIVDFSRQLASLRRARSRLGELSAAEFESEIRFRTSAARRCLRVLEGVREQVTLTHGDYLPQNLLLSECNELWVCDWEMARWHSGITDAFRAALFHNCGSRLSPGGISIEGLLQWLARYCAVRKIAVRDVHWAPFAYLLDQVCDLRRFGDYRKFGAPSDSADLLMSEDGTFLRWLDESAPEISFLLGNHPT